ncbi:hypothetical protein NL676_014057 [Syzygium grande]|nr:hypothetical protein NL676_014057 [Syzygium grande]
MADGMPLPPPPPPSHKRKRIHHHHHRREGEGFTDSDVAAAHQLIQLSDDSDEDKRKLARDGGSSSVGGGGGGGVDREVSSARIEAVFDRERGDRGREVPRRPGRKRFRSIAEIYAVTKPIESRRMSGHNVIR